MGSSVGSNFSLRFCKKMLNTGKSDLWFFSEKKTADTPWSALNQIVQTVGLFSFSILLGKSLNKVEVH